MKVLENSLTLNFITFYGLKGQTVWNLVHPLYLPRGLDRPVLGAHLRPAQDHLPLLPRPLLLRSGLPGRTRGHLDRIILCHREKNSFLSVFLSSLPLSSFSSCSLRIPSASPPSWIRLSPHPARHVSLARGTCYTCWTGAGEQDRLVCGTWQSHPSRLQKNPCCEHSPGHSWGACLLSRIRCLFVILISILPSDQTNLFDGYGHARTTRELGSGAYGRVNFNRSRAR